MRKIIALALLLLSSSAQATDIDWTDWTPIFSATTCPSPCTMAVGTTIARYRTERNTVFIQMAFGVEVVGNASGGITVTIPVESRRGATFTCMVYNTKQNCNAVAENFVSTMKIYLYDGTFPVKSNQKEIILEGFYEIAAP